MLSFAVFAKIYLGSYFGKGIGIDDLIEQLSKFIAENLQSAPNATVEELIELRKILR